MAIISPARPPRDETSKEIVYNPCDLTDNRRGIKITCKGVAFPIDDSGLRAEIAELPSVDALLMSEAAERLGVNVGSDAVIIGLVPGMSAQQASRVAGEINRIVATHV